MSFEKYVTKLNLTLFFKKSFPLKASTYRKYDQAYYEEIVINNDVEQRVAQNYRERFLVTAEDIYIVFGMYCKEDYDEQFQRTPKDEITHKQFIDLFIICLRNDSFKIAILIYTLYLQPSVDMDNRMMDILMSTIRESVKFHEMKLFFLHEHFDVLSISQMNQLIDIYQEILNVKDPKNNPSINQFNTIKIALLIYRICWKIEQKQIYSLITKCSLLQAYLIKSLSAYFERQSNILVLYKFMSEPILHMTEKKDSLDVMYEMNMQELLKHPVVIEVLNLVYEGKFSVSSSELSMSQTFQCMLDMDTMSLKSITERLIFTITNFGDSNNSKQTSVQYNIWKQSIQQREKDEMRFTVIFCGVLICIAIAINMEINGIFSSSKETFTQDFQQQTSIFINAPQETIKEFCPGFTKLLVESYGFVSIFNLLIIISTIGMICSSIQKIVIFRVKDNVSLNYGLMLLELSIAATGLLFILMIGDQGELNTLNSDVCGQVYEMGALEKEQADRMYTLINPQPGALQFKLLMSVIMIQLSCLCIVMLQRTQYLGELIMMLDQMTNELIRFFATFGLVILLFLLVGRMLSSELKEEHASFFQAFLDLFNAFNGNQEFENFKVPTGQIYIAVFMYIFKVLLMSLLAAMFINKYKQVWKNLEAYRRFNIIRLKNSVAYDKFLGAVTITFFPINILMLPFIPPITILRSARASDFLLKLQYVIMIILYCILACIIVVPIVPLLYFKMITNAIFICFVNNREEYKGQNIVQLIITVFLGPPIIAICILIDLLSLPNILLKDSKGFEHKYQLSSDRLNDAQIEVVMVTFGKIFYGQNFQNFKGKNMTLIQLMQMHRKIFSLIDNLHDLICRGNKNYKESLSNVQDYNMTKILTRSCSIPNTNGVFKDAKVELDVIYAVQFDIELYNYVDVVLRKLKMGKLYQESIDKINRKGASAEEEKNEQAAIDEQNFDEEDEETKKMDGIFPIGIGPDGVPLKRNNSDVMNNFFIESVSKSFTDIEKVLANVASNGEMKRVERFKEEITKQKVVWENQTLGAFNTQADKYEAYVKKEIGGSQSGKRSDTKSSSGQQKTTMSTNSAEFSGETKPKHRSKTQKSKAL